MSVLCFEAPTVAALDLLEDELTRAFLVVRSALERGDCVVVIVDDRDIQGVSTTAGAALAHGLLGLVRALAIEGRKPGWQVNMLSIAETVDPDDRVAWLERLSAPRGASGALIRLGDQHLGRLPA